MPYLAFNLNDGNEFIFDLLEERLSLGRNPRNEIVIDNSQISSFHAEFARQPNGTYLLTDLKSSNGTYVNGRRVESAALKPGDRVRFGQLEARFREMHMPGPGREKKGPAPSAEEKRRHADSTEGPGARTDSIPLENAPVEATVPASARTAPTPNVQPIAPTCPPPGSSTTIPKPTPAPLQIVARAPAPASSPAKPPTPPPRTTPQNPTDGSAPQPARMPVAPQPATTHAHELQDQLATLKADIAGAKAQLDKLRDEHAGELDKRSAGRAAMEKEQAALAAKLLATREDLENLERERGTDAKELERLAAQRRAREEELTGLLARVETLAGTESRLASAEEALKLATEQKSAAEAALDDLRKAHEQEQRKLDEVAAGHAESRKQLAETEQQISQLKSEHALLEKSAAEARATAATAETHAAKVLELDTAIAAKQSALDAACGQLREIETRREDKEREIAALAEQGAAQHTLLQTLSEQRAGLEELIATLERTVNDANKRLADIESRATELEGKSTASRAELENARAGVAQAATDLQSHRDEVRAAATEKERHLAETEDAKSRLATVTKLLEEASARQREVESRAIAAEGEVREHQTKVDALLATMAEKAALVASLDERHGILTEAAAKFTAEEASQRERLAALEKQLAENTGNLETKRAELAETVERLTTAEQRSLDLEQNNLKAQASLDAVEKQHRENRVAVEELAARAEALRHELIRLERETTAEKERESSAASAAEQRQEELTALEEQVAASRDRHNDLAESVARIAAEEASCSERLATLERQLAENTEKLETKRAELANAVERISTAEKKSLDLEETQLKAQAALEAVEKQRDEARSAVDELAARKQALSLELSRLERETVDGREQESAAAVAAGQRRKELAGLEEQVAATRTILAQVEAAQLEAAQALQAAKNQAESLQAASAGLTMEVSAAQSALRDLAARRTSEEHRTALLAAMAISRQQEIEEAEFRLNGLRQQRAQGEETLRQVHEQLMQEDLRLNAARGGVVAAERSLADFQRNMADQESTLAGRVAQLTRQIEDLRLEEDGLAAGVKASREQLRRGEASLQDLEKKIAANEARHAAFLQDGDKLLSLNEALLMLEAKERATSRRLSEAAEQELSQQVKLSALNESVANAQQRLDQVLRERAHEEEDRARALEKAGRDLEEARHRASEEARLLEITLSAKLRERVRDLEAKHEVLRRSLQASTDENTVILFANDLIKRIDLIDILIQRVTGPGINGGMEQQLRTLRASFEDILEAHGIAEFKVAPGTEVDVDLRQHIAIVESVSGPSRPRVVESYRPGFVYTSGHGREVVIRKVEVKTSSE